MVNNKGEGVNYLVVNFKNKLDIYRPGELADYEFEQYLVRGGEILYYDTCLDSACNIAAEAMRNGVECDEDIYSILY